MSVLWVKESELNLELHNSVVPFCYLSSLQSNNLSEAPYG